MIWGMTLEPGQEYTEVIGDEVQLSMATMESRGCLGSKTDSFSHVLMKSSTAEYLLCTLVSGVIYQQNLDLKLMPNDKVTFSVQGTNIVYLTGYSYMATEVTEEETQLEGAQVDDWIEEPNLDASLLQDSSDLSGMNESYFPPAEQEDQGDQEDDQEDDIQEREDERSYSVAYSEDQNKYQPETTHEGMETAVNPGIMRNPPTTESRQTTQEPTDSADVELVDIKEEIHTIVDTADDETIQQTGGREVREQTVHLPSTSTGFMNQPKHSSIRQRTQILHREMVSTEIFHDGQINTHPAMQSNLMFRTSSLPASDLSRFDDVPANQSAQFNQPSGYSYINRVASKLYIHQQRKETQRGTFSCRICRGQFDNYQAKLSHEGTHRCRYCHKDFLQIKHKEQHELIHGIERPHKCRFCGKGFRDQTTRAQHERIHTGEKPFKCRHCEMRFPHRESKRRHERKHGIPTS